MILEIFIFKIFKIYFRKKNNSIKDIEKNQIKILKINRDKAFRNSHIAVDVVLQFRRLRYLVFGLMDNAFWMST